MSGIEERSHAGRKGVEQDRLSGPPRQNTSPRDPTTNLQQARRGGAGRGQEPTKQPASATNGPTPATRAESRRADSGSAALQEEHIPVNDFNARDVKQALRGPSDTKVAVYKPLEKTTLSARSGGPWASKPSTMANGKDFFLELRKQVTAVQYGRATSLGG